MNKKIKKLLVNVTLGISLFGGTAGVVQANEFKFIFENAKKQFLSGLNDSISGVMQDSRSVNNERRAQRVLNRKSQIIAQGVYARRQVFGAAGLNCDNKVNMGTRSRGSTRSGSDVNVSHRTRTNTQCDDSAYKNIQDRKVYDDYYRNKQAQDYALQNQYRQQEYARRQYEYDKKLALKQRRIDAYNKASRHQSHTHGYNTHGYNTHGTHGHNNYRNNSHTNSSYLTQRERQRQQIIRQLRGANKYR